MEKGKKKQMLCICSESERLERIEAMLEEILKMLGSKKTFTDNERFKKAIKELARGNKKELERYLTQGGIIPKSNT